MEVDEQNKFARATWSLPKVRNLKFCTLVIVRFGGVDESEILYQNCIRHVSVGQNWDSAFLVPSWVDS